MFCNSSVPCLNIQDYSQPYMCRNKGNSFKQIIYILLKHVGPDIGEVVVLRQRFVASRAPTSVTTARTERTSDLSQWAINALTANEPKYIIGHIAVIDPTVIGSAAERGAPHARLHRPVNYASEQCDGVYGANRRNWISVLAFNIPYQLAEPISSFTSEVDSKLMFPADDKIVTFSAVVIAITLMKEFNCHRYRCTPLLKCISSTLAFEFTSFEFLNSRE